MGSRLRLANAVTRMRAPSSSRMLFLTCVAMNSRTSSGIDFFVHLGFRAQDGQPGLEVRRVDLGDQARQEAAPEPVLEGLDRPGRPVGGEHDLLGGPLRSLYVWKNSSWRPSLLSMNWTSSIKRTSHSR